MLLAVVSPMHMSVPIRAGTLMWVWVTKQHPHRAAERERNRHQHDHRVGQLWKLITSSRKTSTTASAMPEYRPLKLSCMVSTWPLSVTVIALGRVRLIGCDHLLDGVSRRIEIAYPGRRHERRTPA